MPDDGACNESSLSHNVANTAYKKAIQEVQSVAVNEYAHDLINLHRSYIVYE